MGGACDSSVPGADDESRQLDVTPVNLTGVWATTGYSSDASGPGSALLRADMGQADGAEPLLITRSASIVLYFDRLLLPVSVIRQSVCLRPSLEAVDRMEDCSEPSQPFTEPEYNPVRRAVTYRLPEGERLLPSTRYRLTVFPRPEDGSAGFLAFDGAGLAGKYTFDFRTQPSGSLAVDEPLPSRRRYCDSLSCLTGCSEATDPDSCAAECDCIGGDEELSDGSRYDSCTAVDEGQLHQLLVRSCSYDGCHGSSGGDPSQLAMGLDLSSTSAIALTAVGRTAHQTQQGEKAQVSEVNPARFGRAMPIISPGDPGNSYLLYKLLINPYNAGSDGITEQEIERLRSAFVVGLPMPPTSSLSGSDDHQLARPTFELIDVWISHGAVTDCE